jgi:monovalent cation:H+ antiporter, CPA1 family
MFTNLYGIITLLAVLTAAFSYVNVRFIKLPTTIGIMIISMVCSLFILWMGKYFPSVTAYITSLIGSIDFETILMRAMLSFLLFAGAIHIDIQKLRREIIPIITYSTIGVIISTVFIGIVMFLIFRIFGVNIHFIYCLLFGSLISPTDPIAVLAILKQARIPSSIEIKISGESLFNDGVGVVVFISLLDIALIGGENHGIFQTVLLFLKEAGGGIIWGIVLGYAGYYLLKSIDHYQVEVMITVAIVMGGYYTASHLHVSGPLAMVVAGIIIGNKGAMEAMSATTRDYVTKFWELIDEMLNALLFLLIGFEMIVLKFDQKIIIIGLIAIVVSLAARYISVYIPTLFMSYKKTFERNMLPILTWGGLRGGISVALALSLPKGEFRTILVSITYIIVVFSILVQGLTIGKLVKKLAQKEKKSQQPV